MRQCIIIQIKQFQRNRAKVLIGAIPRKTAQNNAKTGILVLTEVSRTGSLKKIFGSVCATFNHMSLTIAHRKAAQALNFFARQQGGSINRLKALKLLFFADRYHIRKYGRPVSECVYFAMNHGPVASEAKNIAEENQHLPPVARTYARKFVRRDGNFDFSAVAETDNAVFSETDREALGFAWKYFGKFSKYQLRDITHHYPEWKRHEQKLKAGVKREMIDYADFFKEPDAGYIPCHSLTEEEREVALELFQQRQAFHQHWS